MRSASQCVGRVLRSKKDYGVVVLADRRYARNDTFSQLPHWISEFIDKADQKGIDEETAIEQAQNFMLKMAQPFTFDIHSLKKNKDTDKIKPDPLFT